MKVWTNENKRKGLIASIVVHLIMLFIFIFFGLSYLEPKPEEGIAINLGYMEEGMANPNPVVKTQAQNTPPPPPPTTTQSSNEDVEDVVTQETVESVSINEGDKEEKKPEKEEDTPVEKEVEKPQEEETTKPVETVEEQPKEPEPPKPDAKVNNALSDLFDNQNNSNNSAGENDKPGQAGEVDGKPNSPNFSNPDGMGSRGEGYYLNGRTNLNAPKKYPCLAQGKVVVQIWVDPQGKTVRAAPGKKGSTTTDECLMKIAYESAMETQWSSNPNIGDLQVGYIVFVYRQN